MGEAAALTRLENAAVYIQAKYRRHLRRRYANAYQSETEMDRSSMRAGSAVNADIYGDEEVAHEEEEEDQAIGGDSTSEPEVKSSGPKVLQTQLNDLSLVEHLPSNERKRKQVPKDLILSNEMSSSDRKSREATGQSQRLKQNIPNLPLHKLNSPVNEKKKTEQQLLKVPASVSGRPINPQLSARSHNGGHDVSTQRSIFERNTFRQFVGPGKLAPEEFNPENYPKMIKIREEAIAYREKATQKQINKMYSSKQISPRTFKRKNLELEHWVTKEKEEVKKTKKVFEEEWQKTANMIQHTQQNYDHICHLLKGDAAGHVLNSQRVNAKASSHTLQDQLADEHGSREEPSSKRGTSQGLHPD